MTWRRAAEVFVHFVDRRGGFSGDPARIEGAFVAWPGWLDGRVVVFHDGDRPGEACALRLVASRFDPATLARVGEPADLGPRSLHGGHSIEVRATDAPGRLFVSSVGTIELLTPVIIGSACAAPMVTKLDAELRIVAQDVRAALDARRAPLGGDGAGACGAKRFDGSNSDALTRR